MRHLIPCSIFLTLGTAVVAQVPPELPPPEPVPEFELIPAFICSVTREDPVGTMTSQQSVSSEGIPDARLDGWSTYLAPDGVWINASWDHADPARYNLVYISQGGLDPGRSYRIQVQRGEPSGERSLLLESELERADSNGMVYVFTRWELLIAMVTGAADPHIQVMRDDGAIIRRDAIDSTAFPRILEATSPLQPTLDTMIADYQDQCQFYGSDGFPSTRD